jgi:hypothetical protein
MGASPRRLSLECQSKAHSAVSKRLSTIRRTEGGFLHWMSSGLELVTKPRPACVVGKHRITSLTQYRQLASEPVVNWQVSTEVCARGDVVAFPLPAW